MKIFITGGSGFLGSHVAKILAENNHEIKILVNKRQIPSHLKGSNLKIVRGNLKEKDSFKNELNNIDLIVHIAGSVKSNNESYRNNIIIKKNLSEICVEKKISNFIFISTRGTLGISNPTYLSNDQSNNFENLKYSDTYIQSKIECEKILKTKLKSFCKLIILCPTALIGPDDSEPTPIGLLLKNIINNKINFFIDGFINLIDVRDAANLICKIIETKEFGPGKYGFGNKNIKLSELFKNLKLLKKNIILPYRIPNIIADFIQIIVAIFPFVNLISPFLSRKKIIRLRKGYSCFKNGEKINNLNLKQIDFSKTLNDTIVYFNE